MSRINSKFSANIFEQSSAAIFRGGGTSLHGPSLDNGIGCAGRRERHKLLASWHIWESGRSAGHTGMGGSVSLLSYDC
jgi:hypothetical protein